MKKVFTAWLITICALSFAACGTTTNQIIENANESQSSAVETTEEQSLKEENSIIDYSELDNEEFADKIAKDFSTSDVIFTSRKEDDDFYFLDATGTDDIDIHIGFSDYGNNITISFVTDGSEDECYYVLQKALQSEVFNIPLDDQIDILAYYMVDEISYKKGSLRITETIKDNIRVIGIRL